MECQNDNGMEIGSFEVNFLNGHRSINEIITEESPPIPEVNKSENLDLDTIDDPYVQSDISVISQVFKDIYEQRIIAIEKDENLDTNRKNQEKLRVLEQHLEELQDQNDTFVSTLLELEKEAHQRVKQMEKRLKSSAKTTMEAVINVHDCAKEMRKIVEERIYVESLYNDMQQHVSNIKEENVFLRDQNCNLNHDIQALLQVIHHARSTGHWEMNCVTFCEVTPEQVFGPVQSISTVCHSDSPQLDFQVENERKVFLFSFLTNSNISSSCVAQSSDNQLSELRHQSTIKNPECDCNFWKLEMLAQQNRNRQQMCLDDLQSSGTSLLKCISLPEIGNIYSFTQVSRKFHSHGMFNNARTICMKAPKRQSVKSGKTRCDDVSDIHRCGPVVKKYDHSSYISRGQSEPHLFMYGDNLYVYRPCEPIKKISTLAFNDDYEMSLPPCQSIDLKFPSDGSNNKISDWTGLSKSESYSAQQSSYFKGESSCSCTSSDPDIGKESKKIYFKSEVMKGITQSSSVQTDEIVKFSVSLQAAIKREDESDCMCSCSDPGVERFNAKRIQTLFGKNVSTLNDVSQVDTEDGIKEKSFQRDIHQMINIMQTMKENLVKAEDKAAAKEILLAQLQGHLTSAVKEVEMKDTALNNLEKKLEISRNESTDLKNQISQLLKDLDDMQMLNDNLLLKVNAKEDNIQEMLLEQKVLQEQKRTLLTQLDAQGDELDKTKQELGTMRNKAESCALQVEQQNQIIRSLQEALVQSKRAFDATHQKAPLLWEVSSSSSHFENEAKSSSKSSIVDI